MLFDQAFRRASILLASVSFIAVVLGTNLPEWLAVLTGSALIFSLLRTSDSKAIHCIAAHATFSTTTSNILVLLGFLVFWVDSLWISKEFLSAGIRFLLILMVIKLGNLQITRDYLYLNVISLGAMLAAASLTADLWYLPIFVAYLLTGVWALLLFQVAKHSESIGASIIGAQVQPETSESFNRVTSRFFWLANGLAAAAFGLTFAIFFAMPRVGTGFYQKGYGESIRTSGFSNTVNLGSIGPIKRDQSIVMRVELPDQTAHGVGRLYLRGTAFDRYDGRSWENQLSHRHVMTQTSHGTFSLNRSQAKGTPHLGSFVRQNILLEPLDTPVLFAAPFAETIGGKLPSVLADLTGTLYLPFPGSTRLEYSVVSRSNPVLPVDLQSQPIMYTAPFLRHFVQLPAQSDRIAALAEGVVQNKRNTYEQAVAIQDYLSRNYRYSLDVPLAEQANPIEEFLFNRKTGYCEHYATAMVIMLRTLGIPARLITGFLATEWNEYGNYYVVRKRDAHAWVELHLPHSGWIMMDPTPPSEESAGQTASAWQAWERILDHARLRWNHLVVQYSEADQLALVRGLQTSSATARIRTWNSFSGFFDPLVAVMGKAAKLLNGSDLTSLAEALLLVLTGLCLFLGLGQKRSWKGGLFSGNASRDEPAGTHLYKQMIMDLASRGILKPVAMGPLEFLSLIQKEWNTIYPLATVITELYCRERFGQRPVTLEEYRSGQSTLHQLLALELQGPTRKTCVSGKEAGAGNGI